MRRKEEGANEGKGENEENRGRNQEFSNFWKRGLKQRRKKKELRAV